MMLLDVEHSDRTLGSIGESGATWRSRACLKVLFGMGRELSWRALSLLGGVLTNLHEAPLSDLRYANMNPRWWCPRNSETWSALSVVNRSLAGSCSSMQKLHEQLPPWWQFVVGWVTVHKNLDVLTCAGRSQHASVSLEGISKSFPRVAQSRFGDTRATQTAPSKMEVQGRGATAAVVNRVRKFKGWISCWTMVVSLMEMLLWLVWLERNWCQVNSGPAFASWTCSTVATAACGTVSWKKGWWFLFHSRNDRFLRRIWVESSNGFLRSCSKLRIAVHVWVSASEGVDHRNPRCASVLVNQPDAVARAEYNRRSCRHAHKLGETLSRIGRETCRGWGGFRV